MFTDNDQKQDITAEVTEYTENLGNSLADYRTRKFFEKKQIDTLCYGVENYPTRK